MNELPAVATIVWRVMAILRGDPDVGRTPEYVAAITGLEFDQVWRALARLARAGVVLVQGKAAHGSPIYQLADAAAELPRDGRGKHHQHLSGAQWATSRKRRANLVKARAARKNKKRVTVMGVVIGGGNG